MNTLESFRQPKYAAVVHELRELIRRGELRPGDRLPSYAEMKARGISQPTLDRVHSILEHDGLIEKRMGSGVFVAQRSPKRRGAEASRARTKILGCVGASHNARRHPYHARVLAGVQEAAQAAGYDLLLFHSMDDARWELLDGVLALGYSGLGTSMRRPQPMPCVGVLMRGVPFSHVATDDSAAVGMLTRHLIGLGHRRIAYLHAEDSVRIGGYEQALRDAAIELDPKRMRLVMAPGEKFDEKMGYVGYGERAVREWLRGGWSRLGCTALLCHNDEVAVGALKALRTAGLRVPEDVSVAGFDGLELAEHTHPPLTTMEVPLYEIGRRGMQLLMEQVLMEQVLLEQVLLEQAEVGAPASEPLETLLSTRLLVRASTRATQ